MGYYITLTSSDWEIKESPEALEAIREMPKKFHAIKRGGSSNGEKWFSWMNDTDIENAESVESVFQQLGFDTHTNEDAKTFTLEGYNSKTGQEDLFLAVLAPFTKDGSFIEWEGEDSSLWRYRVNNGRMFVDEAQINWTHAKPYTYYHIDMEPKTMQMRTMHVDVYDDKALAEQLATAEKWDDEDKAYYAQIRADKELEARSN